MPPLGPVTFPLDPGSFSNQKPTSSGRTNPLPPARPGISLPTSALAGLGNPCCQGSAGPFTSPPQNSLFLSLLGIWPGGEERWGLGQASQTPNSSSLPAVAGGLCLWCPIVWTSKPSPSLAELDAPLILCPAGWACLTCSCASLGHMSVSINLLPDPGF